MNTNDYYKVIESFVASEPDMDHLMIRFATELARIGEESLEKDVVVGRCGYKGVVLPAWKIKEGKRPFHVKDPITGEFKPDPRVLMLGQVMGHFGHTYERKGPGYMYELYIDTGQRFHQSISDLGYAWSSISWWQEV